MIRRMLVKNVMLPVAQLYMGNHFYEDYRTFRESRALDHDTREAACVKNLRAILLHAYSTVPMYQKLYKAARVSPDDIRVPGDLASFPIVTKDTFRRHFPEECTSTLCPRSTWIMDSTSGSTGTPFQFVLDRRIKSRKIANYLRNMEWAGIMPGDRYVKLWGAHDEEARKKLFTSQILRRREISCFDIDEKKTEYYRVLRSYRPKSIEAYTSALVKLSRLIQDDCVKDIRIESAISTAESLYNTDRAIIEQALGCRVFNRYGTREFGNIAQECREHNGLHINSESFFVEVVDQHTGELCPPGKPGKILITCYDNYTMPFIRYDTGDIGVMAEDDGICPCGMTLPMLREVSGRITDFISTTRRSMVPALYFNYFFEQYGEYIRDFQVIQQSPDRIIIRIVPASQPNKMIENTIVEKLTDYLGADVIVEKTAAIELSPAGKKRVVMGLTRRKSES